MTIVVQFYVSKLAGFVGASLLVFGMSEFFFVLETKVEINSISNKHADKILIC